MRPEFRRSLCGAGICICGAQLAAEVLPWALLGGAPAKAGRRPAEAASDAGRAGIGGINGFRRRFFGEPMAAETWRLSRAELRGLLSKYENAVDEDARALLRPSPAEARLLGAESLAARAEAIRRTRDVNRRLIEAVLADLPEAAPAAAAPTRTVAEFRDLPPGTPSLPSTSYGSMASVFLHLMRDWSAEGAHVYGSTYGPAIRWLRALRPGGGDVLVPGCGLARLALEIASEGYRVEANEGSRLFLTFADYVLNRAASDGHRVHPLAHVFSENWGHEQQYLEITVPTPSPAELASRRGSAACGPALVMVPGDFVTTYGKGGFAHRKFDAIVTCFFLDTAVDIAELVEVLDGLLVEGGVWINVGPLNWRKDARLKLNYEEVMGMWRSLGYTFHCHERAECDYHLRRGVKMYTESYTCALTAATKPGPTSKV